MSLRASCFLVVAALVHAGALPPAASSTNSEKEKSTASRLAAMPPQPMVLPSAKKLNELQKAYLDSYRILSQGNPCSDSFGGPLAIHALNGLVTQMRPTYLDKGIVIKMGGEAMLVRDEGTGFSYRLFERAEVNLLGPFYQGNNLPNQPVVPTVGRFEPNTREARVTVLLHELGHLVFSKEGGWLLPDDGYSPSISQANTDRIVSVCGEQIRNLHKFTFEQQLMAAQSQQGGGASPAE